MSAKKSDSGVLAMTEEQAQKICNVAAASELMNIAQLLSKGTPAARAIAGVITLRAKRLVGCKSYVDILTPAQFAKAVDVVDKRVRIP